MADWLRNLKPGDTVLVERGDNLQEERVCQVDAGYVWVRGTHGVMWDLFRAETGMSCDECARLLEPTPERMAKARRQRFLAQLDTVRWEDLPTERLAAVWALVTGVET